jgi:hypothetical protein
MTPELLIDGAFLCLIGAIFIGMGVRQRVPLAALIGVAFIAVGIGIAIGKIPIPV